MKIKSLYGVSAKIKTQLFDIYFIHLATNSSLDFIFESFNNPLPPNCVCSQSKIGIRSGKIKCEITCKGYV